MLQWVLKPVVLQVLWDGAVPGRREEEGPSAAVPSALPPVPRGECAHRRSQALPVVAPGALTPAGCVGGPCGRPVSLAHA